MDRRSSRPSVRPLAWILAVAWLTAACAPDAATDATRSAGLLVLSAAQDAPATLTVAHDAGAGVEPVGLDTPGPATTWVAAGRADVLVATLADGSLHLSGPLDPDEAGGPAWRPLEAVDLGGDPPLGPFWFPTWDPQGGRFAAIAGDLAGGAEVAVTLIDPTTNAAFTIPLERGLLAAAPAWLSDERLVVVGGSSAEPVAMIVDPATGTLTDGPTGDRRIATSADGLVVAASAGPGAPVIVRSTTAWLAGDGTSIGSVDPPADGATATSLALDRTGERLAVAWLVGGTVRIDVHDGSDGWRRVASTTDDGAAGAVVGWLR